MTWPDLIAYFFGGAFLVNAVPHGVSGVMGRRFRTPFVRLTGGRTSSALVNVLWSVFNLAIAWLLLACVGAFDVTSGADALAAGLGGLAMGLALAKIFERDQKRDAGGES